MTANAVRLRLVGAVTKFWYGIFRHTLIVLFLLLAQVSRLAHSFEHLRTDDDDVTRSSQEICSQVSSHHDLDFALASLSMPAPQCAAPQAVPAYVGVRLAERFLVFLPARAPCLSD